MAYCPRYELGTFDDPRIDAAWKVGILRQGLAPIIMANRAYLRTHPEWPGLYKAGLKGYKFNRDHWRDIPTLLKYGEGDCKDFTAVRIAELLDGYDPRFPYGVRAAVHVTTDRRTLDTGENVTMYHVLVRFPNGTLEDPSRMLGMPG